MITKITDTLFAETYEDVRQIDVARLQRDLERMKTERMEVKTVPDQETLDYWNNEATMRNEATQARIKWIEDKLKAIKQAGLLVAEYDGLIKAVKL